MTTMNVLVILGAAQAPAGRCTVCGQYVRDGDGFVFRPFAVAGYA